MSDEGSFMTLILFERIHIARARSRHIFNVSSGKGELMLQSGCAEKAVNVRNRVSGIQDSPSVGNFDGDW